MPAPAEPAQRPAATEAESAAPSAPEERRSRRLERLRRQADAAGLTAAPAAAAPTEAAPVPGALPAEDAPAESASPARDPRRATRATDSPSSRADGPSTEPAASTEPAEDDELAQADITVLRPRTPRAAQAPVPGETRRADAPGSAPDPSGDHGTEPREPSARRGAHGRTGAFVDAPSPAPHHDAHHAAAAPLERTAAEPAQTASTAEPRPSAPAPTAPERSAPERPAPAPADPTLGVPPAPAVQDGSPRDLPDERAAQASPEAPVGDGHQHRRRATASRHTPDVSAALGASPALEAAQAEIEAMAAAREAALRRALAKRSSPRPPESFDAALGLPPVPAPDQARDESPARPPASQAHQRPRVAPHVVPPTAERPAVQPSGYADRLAAAGNPSEPSSTTFSDLLGIPAPEPLPRQQPKAGRRARAAAASQQQREAQRRLENTGLIAPVTQEISVVLPPSQRTPDLNGVPEGAMPLAAQRAHGLDPLEYRSAGVGRVRWGIVVVAASVVVAITSVIVALSL